MTHWQKYGRAYAQGLLFFVVTNALAIQGVFGKLTPTQITSMSKVDWLLCWVNVLAIAGANLLAFLNQSATTPKPPTS